MFQPFYTDGVTILSEKPTVSPITVHATGKSSQTAIADISFSWTAFSHTLMWPQENAMGQYEWTLAVDYQGHQPAAPLMPWMLVNESAALQNGQKNGEVTLINFIKLIYMYSQLFLSSV